jgi:hypothetical protein
MIRLTPLVHAFALAAPLFVALPCARSGEERPREDWSRDLPALSRDGKRIALPMRSRFTNWVADTLLTSVHIVPVGKTKGRVMQILDSKAPAACATLVESEGASPDLKIKESRKETDRRAQEGQPPVRERPANCPLRGGSPSEPSSAREPGQPGQEMAQEQVHLADLQAYLQKGGYQTLPFYRRPSDGSSHTELHSGDLGLSLVLRTDAKGRGEHLELLRPGVPVRRIPLKPPAPIRKTTPEGPRSRVVLDSIDGVAALPGKSALAYVLLVWADELNGRKVSYRFDEWIAVPTGGKR